jgi:integrase
MMSRRSNGQGHTYKVGNSYRTVIHCNGHVVTAMAGSLQESRRRAKEKLEKIPQGKVSNNALPLSKMTLGKFLLDWLENEHQHRIAHSTYKRYRALAIHHIYPVIAQIQIRKVLPTDITSVLSQMREQGQSPRSQQQARALLSVALGEAENKGYISLNPVKKVRIPINRVKEMHPLGIGDVKRLLETYKGTYMCARLHIALLTGLRQGEALGIRWQDIDFDSATLEVRNQVQKIDGHLELTGLKTDRSRRVIALTGGSLESLKQHRQIIESMKKVSGDSWQENDLVFPHIDGTFHPAILDYNAWKRCLRLCGIKQRRLHDARHTAATLMYSQGVGIEVISRALGHSSSAITSKLYVHSALKPLQDAALLLNESILRNTV